MPIFPIHDLAREDDIRMRRRRAVFLLGGIVVMSWMLVHRGTHEQKRATHHPDVVISQGDVVIGNDLSVRSARLPRTELDGVLSAIPLVGRLGLSVTGAPLPQPAANAPSRDVQAAALTVELQCAASVTVLPQADLGDRIIVSVRRGQEGVLRALSLEGGVVAGTACSHGDEGDVILRVAPSKPIRIRQSGSVDIRAGSLTGPVTIESGGSGSVVVDSSGSLTVRQRSSGDVFIGSVNGAVDAELNGSGDLRINDGTIPHLAAVLSSSGDLALGRSRIGSARLVLNGGGDVVADRIDGNVEAVTNGSGDITIDTLEGENLHAIGAGSGDIMIRHGRIGTLSAEREGSGDLTVQATVGNGSIVHHGSGDVTVPYVTGALTRVGSGDE